MKVNWRTLIFHWLIIWNNVHDKHQQAMMIYIEQKEKGVHMAYTIWLAFIMRSK